MATGIHQSNGGYTSLGSQSSAAMGSLSADTRPLLVRSATTTGTGSHHTVVHTGWLFARPGCYKTLLAIVLVFLLMQFTANFVAVRHKWTVSQALTSTGAQWPDSQHRIHHRVPEPTIGAPKRLYITNTSDIVVTNNRWLLNDSLVIINRTSAPVTVSTTTASSTPASVTTVDPIVTFVNNTLYTARSTSSLELCPLVPPKLVGRLKVLTESPMFEKLEEMMPELESGGRYRPPNCQSRHKMAIVIPYRDREEHLRTFLLNIHPMLERQQLDYGIYIVEENGNGKFNRAKLMNIGFLEALKQYDYQCFIFHDVDLIPEDDRNLYTCPDQPRHMSVAIDKFSYRLPYKDLFGGVSALTTEQFKRINGFSNEFWGWGGEDDDMSNRVRHYGYKISRYSASIARYKMLKHKGDTPNPDRYKKLYSGKRRYKTDGINNIKYKVVDLVFKRLYTWILVDLKSP